jgi:transposase
MQMNAVGIDVSKGKSMIAVMRPFGEVVASPYEVRHTASELGKLASFLKSLNGETRVVMEYTGRYYQPIARFLHEAGLFVSVVHAQLIHNYGNNTIRKVKTDKKDAVKIAGYALTNWLELREYAPEDDVRLLLKTCSRQYNQYMKLKTMLKNNLIALLDQTFPGVNTLFDGPPRKADGHEKWVDFAATFWHCQCVCGQSENAFKERYRKWCVKTGYHYRDGKAGDIYAAACGHVNTLPKNDCAKLLITQAVVQLNSVSETLAAVLKEMRRLAAMLPEYPVVMSMYGVGETLGPQLIAEIGDVRRFAGKGSLVSYAGVEAPPFQSGSFESSERSISKQGPPALRKALFQVMTVILQNSPADEPVFQFLDRKRAERKPYCVYMVAGCNKFLRIYYARVKQHLNSLGC